MNPNRLSPRDRRALMAGVVMLIFVGAVRGVPGWIRWRADVRATAAEGMALLASREASIRELDSTLDSAEIRIARFRDLGGALFVAQDSDEVIRTFRALLHDAGRTAGARLTIREIHSDSILRPWTVSTIGGRVHLETDFTGLREFLARLHASGVIVSTPDATITVTNGSVQGEEVEVLDVEMIIEVGVMTRDARGADTR